MEKIEAELNGQGVKPSSQKRGRETPDFSGKLLNDRVNLLNFSGGEGYKAGWV
jgi:hypothetical protein